MKANSFLALLFTLIAILTLLVGIVLQFSNLLQSMKGNCDGYSFFLFPDATKLDTEVGKGQLLKIRAINAGNFGDKYDVYLQGPPWTVVKPSSFELKAEESKTLFLYVSPDVGNEGKYDLYLTVKSGCVSESQMIEIGVLPKVSN
jgi:hypothetical protein